MIRIFSNASLSPKGEKKIDIGEILLFGPDWVYLINDFTSMIPSTLAYIRLKPCSVDSSKGNLVH